MAGMQVLYEETEHGIRILRCFGECSEAVLPERVCGKPVTELGDYIFADGSGCLAEGKWWGCGEEKREKKGECGEVLSLPALRGSAVQSISIPESVRRIGRYAFYNCCHLSSLTFYSCIRDVCAGAFTGCRKLRNLKIRAVQGERSCFREVLSELSQELLVEYHCLERSPGGELRDAGEARLLFPNFYEEAVENTPARILETHIHGCGHRYRYAFDGTSFLFREYDRLFPWLTAQGPSESAALLALGRLRYPLELGSEAKDVYMHYVAEHLDETAACLLKEGGLNGFKWLVQEFFMEGEKKVEHAAADCLGNEGFAVRAHEEYFNIWKPALGKTGLGKLIELSNRAGRTEIVSFLMDASYQLFPPKRKRFEF